MCVHVWFVGQKEKRRMQLYIGLFFQNAVTHATSDKKVSKTFIWNNPDGMDVFFQ